MRPVETRNLETGAGRSFSKARAQMPCPTFCKYIEKDRKKEAQMSY